MNGRMRVTNLIRRSASQPGRIIHNKLSYRKKSSAIQTTRYKMVIKFVVLSVAIAACLSIDWIEAQKTIQQQPQQQQQLQQSWSGSGQNSVYGGYGANAPVSPVKQQKRPAAPVSNGSGARFSQQSIRQQSYQRPQAVQPVVQQEQSSYSSSYEQQSSQQQAQQAEADAEPASYGSVAGQAGRDFPNYSQVPKTSFSCDGVPYEYGMYADEETGCQAYHLCYNGRKDSFLCGPGTVFNQRILHCDYWYSVDCGKSSQYYSSNAYMGSSQPEPGPAQANGAAPAAAQQQASYSSQSSSRQTSYQRPVQVGRQSSSASSFSRNTQQQVEENY